MLSGLSPRYHLDALLLALASSTDNFTVGISIGITSSSTTKLPFAWINIIISICNALGALLAGLAGKFMITSNKNTFLPAVLAACAFGVLAFQELYLYYNDVIKLNYPHKKIKNPADSKSSVANLTSVWKLAIPMTLNNLAGGVAGGAVGLSPGISALYALNASFISMSLGHFVGFRLGGDRIPCHPSLISACLLGFLCLMTIQEIVLS
jgi:putative Mn2+ efflux pump MntP